jgi:hypothetical protein
MTTTNSTLAGVWNSANWNFVIWNFVDWNFLDWNLAAWNFTQPLKSRACNNEKFTTPISSTDTPAREPTV